MIPVVYQCVSELDSDPQDEYSFRGAWQADPPQPGDRVSMGGSDRWEVIEILPYANAAETPPDAYLVQVHLPNTPLPTRDRWSCRSFAADFPDTTVFLFLTGGKIQVGFDMRGTVPSAGERLMDYEPPEGGAALADHPTLRRAVPIEWVVDRVETYQGGEDAPYPALHLCHCAQTEAATV